MSLRRVQELLTHWMLWSRKRSKLMNFALLCALLCNFECLANPLAGPGARSPSAPAHGPGRVVAPGKPLDLRWSKVKPTKPVTPPRWAGRTIGGRDDRVIGVSPDGDGLALLDPKGRARILQLLTGRVSPYLKVAKGANIRLAVSGFATLIIEGSQVRRVHSWTGKARGAGALPTGGAWSTDAALQNVVWAGLQSGQLCVHRMDLVDPTLKRCRAHAGVKVVGVTISDSGRSLWVTTVDGAHTPSVSLWDLIKLRHLQTWTGARPWTSTLAQAGSERVHVRLHGGETSRLSRIEDAQADAKLKLCGALVEARDSERLVQLCGELLVLRNQNTGAPADAFALPRGARCRLASDGRHLHCHQGQEITVWDPLRGARILQAATTEAPWVTRSRIIWRAPSGALVTSTWLQLQGSEHSGGLLSAWARARAVSDTLTQPRP